MFNCEGKPTRGHLIKSGGMGGSGAALAADHPCTGFFGSQPG
jgi:hypothetical protein